MNRKYETIWGQPLEITTQLPFSPLLPSDTIGLLKWRLYVRERCLHDKDFRDLIDQMCEQDCIFFILTFVYFHETRETEENIGVFPAILDPDQEDILAVFQKHCGKIDGVVDKTRGIGLSYLVAAFCIWKWRYNKNRIEIGLVSKDDRALDVKDRPSTLMGKLDMIFEHLPAWMRFTPSGELVLRRTHTNHIFEHKFNKNLIQGYTSGDDNLRSARLNLCFVDEGAFLEVQDQRFLASAYGTCPSIWWISTHNGRGTLFHRMTENTTANLIRLSTYWWNNRRCRVGMYKSVNGRIEILDKDYDFPKNHPDGYEFSHDHAPLPRSIFTDKAFNRPEVDPQRVFEELYGVASLDSRQLIPQDILDSVAQFCTQPICRGFLDPVTGEFREDNLNGPIYFWHDPMNPFTSLYYIGCDPSLGVVDAALAGLCVIDAATGRQVISAAFETCPPAELANIAVQLAKLITGPRGAGFCTIAYESTGINVAFATELNRLQWPAIFMERNSPGVHNRDRGMSWIMELGRAISTKEAVISDARILDDLSNFEVENDTFELLYTGQQGHGDLVIASAIAWWAARQRRQSYLTSQKKRRELQVGIEAEPIFRDRKRKNEVWSNKFSD